MTEAKQWFIELYSAGLTGDRYKQFIAWFLASPKNRVDFLHWVDVSQGGTGLCAVAPTAPKTVQ